jgi:hypothetical protein
MQGTEDRNQEASRDAVQRSRIDKCPGAMSQHADHTRWVMAPVGENDIKRTDP